MQGQRLRHSNGCGPVIPRYQSPNPPGQERPAYHRREHMAFHSLASILSIERQTFPDIHTIEYEISARDGGSITVDAF